MDNLIPTKLQQQQIILLNKPYRVLCQFSAHENKTTLAQFCKIPHVYPAGRLDFDSEGLIILTNNGRIQHSICHPQNKLPKTYYVQVEGSPTAEQLQQLRMGVQLKDGLTLPAQVSILEDHSFIPGRNPPIRVRKNIPDTWLQMIITEGRNRQIRRMTAAVGLPTLRLVRWNIGQFSLAQLLPGEWRIVAFTHN